MQITLGVPDEIAERLALLESFALEGYRSGTLSEEQVRRVLGYGTRMQVHGFLKEQGVYELRPGGPGAGHADSAPAPRKRAGAGLNDCYRRHHPAQLPGAD
jgi:uncharacterized protein UPF0175